MHCGGVTVFTTNGAAIRTELSWHSRLHYSSQQPRSSREQRSLFFVSATLPQPGPIQRVLRQPRTARLRTAQAASDAATAESLTTPEYV